MCTHLVLVSTVGFESYLHFHTTSARDRGNQKKKQVCNLN